MSDAIRQDLFQLDSLDFQSPGFYLLKKGYNLSSSAYLDSISVTRNNHSKLEINPSGVVGQIRNDLLYEAVEDGDVATINSRGQLRVILTKKANHNTLLITERCDNRCSFCSQPPKDIDDSWLLSQTALSLAAFQSDATIGISGGEPLLYGEAFIRLLDFLVEHSPNTPLHILSNGRAFADLAFASAIADRKDSINITFGIPLYAARADIHDTLVGVDGAFNETVLGLINAGNLGINLEIRFIPTKKNIKELASTVEFVTRTFSSVCQLSIMNLEATGWARKHWDNLYLSPEQYQRDLVQGIMNAQLGGLHVSLFNYPMCHLTESLRQYAVQSISDWKNYFPDECDDCIMNDVCAGFFVSSHGKYHQPPRRIK